MSAARGNGYQKGEMCFLYCLIPRILCWVILVSCCSFAMCLQFVGCVLVWFLSLLMLLLLFNTKKHKKRKFRFHCLCIFFCWFPLHHSLSCYATSELLTTSSLLINLVTNFIASQGVCVCECLWVHCMPGICTEQKSKKEQF